MEKQKPRISESADLVDLNEQAEKYYSRKEKGKPQDSGDLRSDTCVLYKHLKEKSGE